MTTNTKQTQAVTGSACSEQPAQQEPVAYDKTKLNCFAQDLYDQKTREGKHGHYESMFHVIHQCIKKVAPPASKPLTEGQWQEIAAITGCVRIEQQGRAAILRVLQEAAHGIKGDA